MIGLAWQLMMGVGLAASAGLRAFLPLLVVGSAARVGVLELGARFEWMASTPALTVFGAAVVLEVLADKVPAVDHLLDVVGTVARPVAGAIAAAAPITRLDPLTAVVVGVVMGGAVAGTVHVAKAGTRLISSGVTGGLATPAVSMTEDVLSFSGSVLSIIMPIVTFTLTIGLLYVLFRVARRRSAGAAA